MYAADLAYVHDPGYSSGAKRVASFIVQILQSNDLRRGHLLDLGLPPCHSKNLCWLGETYLPFTCFASLQEYRRGPRLDQKAWVEHPHPGRRSSPY